MGLGVAAFILYSGAMLVKDTIDPLLGAAPDPELVEHIEKKALSYPGVLGVHDLMIHDYGPGSPPCQLPPGNGRQGRRYAQPRCH